MKFKSFSLVVASCVLASVLYGCATSDQRTDPRAGSVEESDQSAFCKWKFTRTGGSKHLAIKDTLQVEALPEIPPGMTCGKVETSTLCIGVPGGTCHPVTLQKDVRGFDWQADGSCRWCYLNSAGGMSCVTYNGSC